MVDCGNSRCCQERRNFRKELLSWAKKVPVAVGLETIATELAGAHVITELLRPFNDLEPDEPSDWHPLTTCFYCQSRNKFVCDLLQEGSSENGPDATGLRYLQQLVPLAFPPSVLPSGSDGEAVASGGPLDLSSHTPLHGKSPSRAHDDLARSPVELKVPQIKKQDKKKDNNRKDSDLGPTALSLQDLQNSRLSPGNNIFTSSQKSKDQSAFHLDSEVCLNSFLNYKHSMADLLQHGPLADPWRALYTEGKGIPDKEHESKLDRIRRKHNLNDLKRPFGLPPAMQYYNYCTFLEYENLYGLSNPFAHRLRFSYLPELARKLVEERFDLEKKLREEQQEENESHPPVSKFGENLMFTGRLLNTSTLSTPAPFDHMADLKVPSYKPASTRLMENKSESCTNDLQPSRNRIGETLKDIIAKTIAEKMKSKTQVHEPAFESKQKPVMEQLQIPYQKRPSDTDDGSLSMQSSPEIPSTPKVTPAKKPKLVQKEIKTESTDDSGKSVESSPEKGSKKTRPKRGQYRKYNAQLLLEAVKAVQRGEMSVHRAGSYFGVPHSTLEYKVKERHLLRQKKARSSPKETKKKEVQGTDEAPKSPTKSNSEATLPAMTTSSSRPFIPALAAMPWLSMGGAFPLGMSSASLPSYGFNQHTSASELLKRLQQKVQAKADGVASNGQPNTA